MKVPHCVATLFVISAVNHTYSYQDMRQSIYKDDLVHVFIRNGDETDIQQIMSRVPPPLFAFRLSTLELQLIHRRVLTTLPR